MLISKYFYIFFRMLTNLILFICLMTTYVMRSEILEYINNNHKQAFLEMIE